MPDLSYSSIRLELILSAAWVVSVAPTLRRLE
jgi:hypothetical protein